MASMAQASFVVGEVRVQPLGAYVVRIEQRGPKGFEDRATFTADPRAFAGAEAAETREDGAVCIATPTYRIVVPADSRSASWRSSWLQVKLGTLSSWLGGAGQRRSNAAASSRTSAARPTAARRFIVSRVGCRFTTVPLASASSRNQSPIGLASLLGFISP